MRPRFLTHIQDVTVDEGDDVTFECKAVGKPMPKFKWSVFLDQECGPNQLPVVLLWLHLHFWLAKYQG